MGRRPSQRRGQAAPTTGHRQFSARLRHRGHGGESHNKRAREVGAGLQSEEVALFVKGYVDFDHLYELDVQGVSRVTRAKDNFQYTALRKLPASGRIRIRKDEIVRLKRPKGRIKKLQGWTLRRVDAWVEVKGWMPSTAQKLWDSRRLVQAAGGRATVVASRIPAIPDIIPWDRTTTSPREKPRNSQLSTHPILPFPTEKSATITLKRKMGTVVPHPTGRMRVGPWDRGRGGWNFTR